MMPLWVGIVMMICALLSPLATALLGARNYGRLEQRVDGHDHRIDDMAKRFDERHGEVDRRIRSVHDRDDKQDARMGTIEAKASTQGEMLGQLKGRFDAIKFGRD